MIQGSKPSLSVPVIGLGQEIEDIGIDGQGSGPSALPKQPQPPVSGSQNVPRILQEPGKAPKPRPSHPGKDADSKLR